MSIILYRDHMVREIDGADTIEIMEKHFLDCYKSRSLCKRKDFGGKSTIVIGRYSVLPYYRELEYDLAINGCVLINTYRQHHFIANIEEWYQVLEGLTPKTWHLPAELPEGKSFVLKGATNSRKAKWKTHMFAEDRNAAKEIHLRLIDDDMIYNQGIYAREYVPLVKLGEQVNGMPVTNEYRFFVCKGQILCGGFYWSSEKEECDPKPDVSRVPESLLKEAITRIGDRATFYTIDVAETQTGDWIIIEINDGQMAGLSDIDADLFYSRLSKVVD